jgi:hypothetical protein
MFKPSQFVRKTTALLLLECLHESKEAQLYYCCNADKTMQLTPSYASAVVLNSCLLVETVFRDVASIKRF